MSPGSLDLTSCLVTAGLTPESSRTSARCAIRSSPAVITCPNTLRSTAAPGPARLSDRPFDTFVRPQSRSPSGLFVLHKQNVSEESWELASVFLFSFCPLCCLSFTVSFQDACLSANPGKTCLDTHALKTCNRRAELLC